MSIWKDDRVMLRVINTVPTEALAPAIYHGVAKDSLAKLADQVVDDG